MSSSDRRRAVAALAAAGAAAACGFTPLYGTGDSDLRGAFRVEGADGREGYRFREQFRRRVGDPRPDAPWTVEVALAFDEDGLGITPDDDVTRYNVDGEARYVVRRRRDGAQVASGVARSVSAYSTTASPYATRIAQQDTLRRVAADLADRVFAQIAAQALPTDGQG